MLFFLLVCCDYINTIHQYTLRRWTSSFYFLLNIALPFVPEELMASGLSFKLLPLERSRFTLYYNFKKSKINQWCHSWAFVEYGHPLIRADNGSRIKEARDGFFFSFKVYVIESRREDILWWLSYFTKFMKCDKSFTFHFFPNDGGYHSNTRVLKINYNMVFK